MARRLGGRVLDADRVVETLDRLEARVQDRFPNSGLAAVCADLADVAERTAEQAERLSRPIIWLRVLLVLLLGAALAAVALIVQAAGQRGVFLSERLDAINLAQGLDALVNLGLLVGGGVWFLWTAEMRLKRARILAQLYELRSFAHVIDMHQLTKDPTLILGGGSPTPASPVRRMTRFELARYLDYCSEMLALTAKLAALYADHSRDAAVMAAVNDVEVLASDLGRKVWQKITILSDLEERAPAGG